jgi:hypothetical protein
MLGNLLRDEATMPAVKRQFEGFHHYADAARDTLMAGRRMRGRARRRRVQAAIGHAVAFTTWRSLARDQGLDDPAAADLMCRLVGAADDGPTRTTPRSASPARA